MDLMTTGNYITIIVLCDDYENAIKAYHSWLNYLECTDPEYIQDYNEATLSVETDEVLRYIFCDYRMEDIFALIADSIISMNELCLFEGDILKY